MITYTFADDVQAIRFGLSAVAGVVASLGVISAAAWKCGLGRIVRRRRDARRAEFAASVAGVVGPMIDESRAAALAQHDQQNNAIEQGFMSVHERIDRLGERLDQGAGHLAQHDIDIAVLKARDPSTRSRKGET